MAVIRGDVRAIAEREASGEYDGLRLCSYGRILSTVIKARAEDEPDDNLTPDELAEKAEKLLAGMRAARR
jgi:hypothetical protein